MQWGTTPGFTRAIRAVRSVTEQWGAHPVTDPLVVKTFARRLPAGDRAAAHSRPAAADTTLDFRRHAGGRQITSNRGRRKRRRGRDNRGQARRLRANNRPTTPAVFLTRGRHWRNCAAAFKCRWAGTAVGQKKDVPKNACFVGHYCDHYVWVMPIASTN